MGKLSNRRTASTRYALNSHLTRSQPAHAKAMGRRFFLGRTAGLIWAASGLTTPIAAGAAVFKESRPIGIQKAAFFDIACQGALLLAVGERGVIARSTDAGESWTTQRLSLGRSLTSLSVTDRLCIAAGHGGLVARSIDQGGKLAGSAVPRSSATQPWERRLVVGASGLPRAYFSYRRLRQVSGLA